MTAKPLKSGIGVRYLAPLIVGYIALIVMLAGPANMSWIAIAQHASAAGVLGLAVLALQELPTRALKEIIVHWRIRDRLPGSRAFTYYAERDARIDPNELRRVLDPLPTAPRDQNAVWYRWLKQNEDSVEVADTHRRYLILRDAAATCLFLAIASVGLLVLPGWQISQTLLLFALCTGAYLVLALAARSVSGRLVTTVIAVKLIRSTTSGQT
jgi:hypothetical protein